MALRTLSATSGRISVMLWAVRACSAASKSQSIPTSLQLTVFAMLISSDGLFMRMFDSTVLTEES
jgi:hypothetical protein